MAAHTIRKASREGTGYSVVDLTDVRHVFAAAVPRCGGTLPQQADDALRMIQAAAQAEGAGGSIVLQSVFVADVGQIDQCRQIVREFYGSDLPATSYIPQRPCDGSLLAIEAMGIGRDAGGGGDPARRRAARHRPAQRHRLGALCPRGPPARHARACMTAATSAFQQMRSLLAGVNVRFDQVIRTWLYLGGIVDDEGATQRYQGTQPRPHRLLPRRPVSSPAVCRRGLRRSGLSGQHGHRGRWPRHDHERDRPGHATG